MATAAVAVVLAVAGIVTVTTVERQLVGDVDDVADAEVARLVAVVEDDPRPDRLVAQGDDDTFAQLVGPDGRVLASTANLEGEPAVAASGRRTVHGLPHDDAGFRVRVRPVDGGTLIVGISLDDVDDSITTLWRTLLVVSPLVLAALAVLVWFVVGRTLRPVELANRRQRRFVADASHELRSPLTRIRAELEVDLAYPDRSDPWATHRRVLAEAVELQALVDDLLLLARTDAGQPRPAPGPVDLDDLVFAEVRRVQSTSDVGIDVTRVSGGQVVGDAAQLQRVVRNLLDNALRHGCSSVTVSVWEEDGTTVLAVTDDGPGIPADQRDRVFERFTRLDDARSADGGTGLGLAITRDLVEGHGGSVTVDPAHRPGTRMVVRLPRAPR